MDGDDLTALEEEALSHPEDLILLGWTDKGQPVRVLDFRSGGFALFMRLREKTLVGREIVDLMRTPTDAELARGAYHGLGAEDVVYLKHAFLALGLSPIDSLAEHFNELLESEE